MQTTAIPSPSHADGKRKPRILVVDDEAEIRQMLRRHFAYEGCDVQVASDGVQALASASEARPDVVITDVNMPNMNGADLAKRLNVEHPMVHVIVITGYVTPSNIVRCMNHGAATCVFKPLQDLTELETAVDTALSAIVRWWDILSDLRKLKQAG